jgi:hypothetical protein
MNHFGKGLCLFLVTGIAMQAAFAKNQVDIIFNHKPAIGAQPTQDIRLSAGIYNSTVSHKAETPEGGLPVGKHSVDNVRSGVFSQDPSGIYEIYVRCFIGRKQFVTASLYRWIPKSGFVNIDVICPTDKAGYLLLPIAEINVHNS